MPATLFQKVWDLHAVRRLPNGQTQLYIGLHLVHEVTSPQAFDELRQRGWRCACPNARSRPSITSSRRARRPAVRRRDGRGHDVGSNGIAASTASRCSISTSGQGIVHVIGPELGLTQPGMTIACGDSHTSTHGAFGAIAFGIGTSQVRDVLASQSLAMSTAQSAPHRGERRAAARACTRRTSSSTIIGRLGVKGGTGFAYEYAGDTIDRMSMDERMTICNMSIEGGARVGYVNPDETTFEYLRGRRFAPQGAAFDRACAWWRSMASDRGRGVGRRA